MKKVIIALLLILLVAAPSYAGGKKANPVATFLNAFSESLTSSQERERLDKQKENLDSDYRNGKMSADTYYEALARMEQIKVEREKAASQKSLQQQQINIQQQQANIQLYQATRPVWIKSGGRSKAITDRNGNVVGYVND